MHPRMHRFSSGCRVVQIDKLEHEGARMHVRREPDGIGTIVRFSRACAPGQHMHVPVRVLESRGPQKPRRGVSSSVGGDAHGHHREGAKLVHSCLVVARPQRGPHQVAGSGVLFAPIIEHLLGVARVERPDCRLLSL